MKNIKKLAFAALLVTFFFSCSKENDETEEIQDRNTPENYVSNSFEAYQGVGCGINGRFKVIPGKIYTYFLSTNLGNSNITWEVQSGLMTITSTNGKYAEVQFSPNFTSGKLRVTNLDTNLGDCSVVLEITKI
jgi:hypothetical protein